MIYFEPGSNATVGLIEVTFGPADDGVRTAAREHHSLVAGSSNLVADGLVSMRGEMFASGT